MIESKPLLPLSPDSFPRIGGIPLDLKAVAQSPERHAVVTGTETGHPIDIRADKHAISITDGTDNGYFFKAEFDDLADVEDPEEIANIITFDIRTVQWNGEERIRQPDFRARDLANQAISYFEGMYGPLNGIRFHWEGRRQVRGKGIEPPSDNYAQYFSTKERLFSDLLTSGLESEEAEQQAKSKAALTTWTATQLGIPRGLTRVRELEEYRNDLTGEDYVSGEFVREASTQ